MSPPGRIVLACSSDAAYAPHASTMLMSAVENTPEASFAVHYLHGPDYPESVRERVRACFRRFQGRVAIRFVEVPDEGVAGLPLFRNMKPGSLRPVMWYRTFLPQLLPDETRVLYLDSDTLVLRDLLPLWRTDLAGHAVAAVTNLFFGGDASVDWALALGLPDRAAYFNTGVMLMDLDHFRKHGVTARILEHGRRNASSLRFGDQDSFNAVLHRERLPLPLLWNSMRTLMLTHQSDAHFTEREMRDARCQPAIVHFEGPTKPWINPSLHPYGRRYFSYARRLPWPVANAAWSLNDVENFLLRRNWIRTVHRFRRLRKRIRV